MATAAPLPRDATDAKVTHDRMAHEKREEARAEEQQRLGASLEPLSLGGSSEHSGEQSLENGEPPPPAVGASPASTDSDYGDSSDEQEQEQEQEREQDQEEEEEAEIKCSAVHTLERDMPTCDYSHLVVQLRALILEHARLNEGLFSPADIAKCQTDDWHVARFLLRHKLDLEAAFEMLKATLRFNHESLANHLRPEDFPAEFYQLGGLLAHGHDRKGNLMLYLRVRLHKRTPEIVSIVQAFIYFNIKQLDEAAQGRGISIVIDCTGAGLANADMETLLFIISTLKSYFPKGLSYFLVHQLPWILKPFWHLAKAWVPDEHRQLIKFSDARSVFEYIEAQQLPDFMGGACAPASYCRVPADCTTLEQAAKLWGFEWPVIRRVLDKFREHLPAETVERIERHFGAQEEAKAVAAAAAALDQVELD